jgi:hypothetical protein
VRANSIIPKKYIRRLSALSALDDNYQLDIYPTIGVKQEAHGILYLDDGETTNHLTLKEYNLIEFTYEDGNLFIKTPHANYRAGQSFIIDRINVYGITKTPTSVMAASGEKASLR